MKNNSVRDCLLLVSVTLSIYVPFLGLPVLDGNEPVRVIIPAGPFVTIGTAAVFEFYLQKAKENSEI